MTIGEILARINIAILLLTSFLPTRLAFSFARLFGALKYRWSRYRYPHLVGRLVMYMSYRLRVSDDRTLAILRRSFELLAMQDLEGCLLRRLTKENSGRIVTFEGIEHLNAALEGGRGALLFTGHTMSNLTLLAALRYLGINVTVAGRIGRKAGRSRSVTQRFRDRQYEDLERIGVEVLRTEDFGPFMATRCVSTLKRNGVIVILVDMGVRRRSAVEIVFINEVARLTSGSAVLAATSGAPLLLLWPHRRNSVLPLIGHIGPPIQAGKDVVSVVQEQARYLEQEIVQDPASWRVWQMRLRSLQRQNQVED